MVVPTISINYPKLEVGTNIVIDQYSDKDSINGSYTKTISSEDKVTEDDGYVYRLYIDDYFKYYVVNVFDVNLDTTLTEALLIYSDTISNVSYELKGTCSHKIRNFSYIHNGIKKTETIINK